MVIGFDLHCRVFLGRKGYLELVQIWYITLRKIERKGLTLSHHDSISMLLHGYQHRPPATFI